MKFLTIKKIVSERIGIIISVILILAISIQPTIASGQQSIDQNKKYSYGATNKNIKDIFAGLTETTGLYFIYNESTISDVPNISVDIQSLTIPQILTTLSQKSNLDFKLNNNNVAVTKKANNSSSISATTKDISGTVVDVNGIPVIGASVLINGGMNGTITDVSGKFTLKAPSDGSLKVTFLGYEDATVSIAGKSNLHIVLEEAAQIVDEVVVVGYGTQKKTNLTGSVEVIGGDKLESRPSSNVSQMLQGQIGGASFTTGDYGYEPGASMTFQIRGQGDAYVLVDGVESSLDKVNPNDIESISVLKDAAAASIYGARATYGVVLITTKNGKNNSKPVVSFSANASVIQLHRVPQMVDSHTFAQMLNEAGDNGGGRVYDNETIDRIIAYQKDPSLPETIADSNNYAWLSEQYSNANYDWFNEYYGIGFNNQENISIRGGSEKVTYYVSIGHVYDGGVLNYGTDDYRRLNTNAKVNFKVTDWMDFTVNTRFAKSEREQPNFDSQGDYDLLFHQIARTFPNQAKITPNGYYTRLSKIPWAQDAGTDLTVDYEATQQFATEIRPLKGWKINADYSFKVNSSRFTSNNFTAYEDLVDGTLIAISTTDPSYVQKNMSINVYNSMNVYTSYEFKVKENHSFTFMAGMQQETQHDELIYGRKNDIITDAVPSLSTTSGEITLFDDVLSETARLGGFFRFNYDYKGKYLIEANGRYDGTSVFADGNRWGFFPSFSAGWNIHKESFFEGALNKVNSLKLRASWGTLGNQNVDAYQDLALLGISSNLSWLINGSAPNYVTASNLVNTNLTWETVETVDVGIDLSMFNNRLTVSADWYQRNTKNQLGESESLPNVIGTTLPNSNNSALRTNGWELSIGWRDQIGADFSYSASVMLYDYYSTVTQFNNTTGILTSNYEGMRVGEIWGYETEGLIQTQAEADQIMSSGYQDYINTTWNTGDVKYKDLDGNGVINKGNNTVSDHGDLKVIGNSSSRYQFAVNLAAQYKGFDVSTLLQGVAKRDLWIDGNMFWGFNTWNQSSLFVGEHLDYYRDAEGDDYSGLGINTDAYFPRPYLVSTSNSKNQQSQSGYIQNGAYLRLKNIQIGYTLPERVCTKFGLSHVRVYFSGDNLATLTGRFPDYMDPETATVGSRGDSKSMSIQEMYSFGLEISF